MKENLSKSKISLIRSLSIKKYRQQHNLFIAEGKKIINEIMDSDLKIKFLFHTDKWIPLNIKPDIEFFQVEENDIKKITNLKTPPSVIAIVEIPETELNITSFKEDITLALDDIQDPGNLGTIVRICDWFGIKNIICSKNSADIFNPKVIQATMGAFLRVNIFYEELSYFIEEYKKITGNICYGTFLEGENIYKLQKKDNNCMIVLGNEGSGISSEIEKKIDTKILIPPFSINQKHAESLNISIATSIVCSEFRRNFY